MSPTSIILCWAFHSVALHLARLSSAAEGSPLLQVNRLRTLTYRLVFQLYGEVPLSHVYIHILLRNGIGHVSGAFWLL